MFDNRRGYYNPWEPHRNPQPNPQGGWGWGGWGGGGANRPPRQPARGRPARPRPPPSGLGRWREHLWTAAIAAASLGVWYATPVSHWVTEVLLWQVPLSDDVMLGRQAMQDGFAYKYPALYDPHYTPLLQSIGHDLVRTHRKRQQRQQRQQEGGRHLQDEDLKWFGSGSNQQYDPYQWDFAVVQSDSINAFALPGGIVRVTSSLLQALQPTKGELAALIGHEMGHVVHRHSQARILQHQLLANVLQAVLDGWYETGGDYRGGGGGLHHRRRPKAESFGGAIGNLLLQSAQWLGDQKFSRRDEYQADAVAWELLLASDAYNPQAVISLLAKLERLEHKHVASTGAPMSTPTSRGITSAIEEWTRTHPATSDRLKALEKKWKELPDKDRRRLQQRRAA